MKFLKPLVWVLLLSVSYTICGCGDGIDPEVSKIPEDISSSIGIEETEYVGHYNYMRDYSGFACTSTCDIYFPGVTSFHFYANYSNNTNVMLDQDYGEIYVGDIVDGKFEFVSDLMIENDDTVYTLECEGTSFTSGPDVISYGYCTPNTSYILYNCTSDNPTRNNCNLYFQEVE